MKLSLAQVLELAGLANKRNGRPDVIDMRLNGRGEYEMRESDGDAVRRVVKALGEADRRVKRWQQR